jgi:hypothetical protein
VFQTQPGTAVPANKPHAGFEMCDSYPAGFEVDVVDSDPQFLTYSTTQAIEDVNE